MVGVAGTWVSSNRTSWTTWEGFCRRIRRLCGVTDRVQQRLAHKVALRTQGSEKSVRDYITCLKAMMRKIEPLPSLVFQLGTLLRDMKPRVQQLLRVRCSRSHSTKLPEMCDKRATDELSGVTASPADVPASKHGTTAEQISAEPSNETYLE